MKKWLCAFLLFSLLLPGCARKKTVQNPVRFYYRTEDVAYFDSTGVIDSEERDAGARRNDYAYLLNEYLRGPENQKLAPTFPDGSAVQDLKLEGDTATVVLNEEFAQLTGIDLSLACACLTLTVCEMTGAERVEISAGSALLDGSPVITVERSQLVLEDLCRVPVEPN